MTFAIEMTQREMNDLIDILREVADTGRLEFPGDATLVKRLQFAVMEAEELDLDEIANTSYDDGYEAGHRDGCDDTFDDAFQQGVDEGYQDGHEAGVSDGRDSGYDEGYRDGFDAGHADGYDEGFAEGERSQED